MSNLLFLMDDAPFAVNTDILKDIPDVSIYLNAKEYDSLTFDGSNIQTWGDLTEFGNDAAQSDSGLRPTYVADIGNGIPGINFTGKWLQFGSAVHDFGNADNTVYMVAKRIDNPGGDRWFYNWQNMFGFYIEAGGTHRWCNNTFYNGMATGNFGVDSNVHIYSNRRTGALLEADRDGVAATDGTAADSTISGAFLGVSQAGSSNTANAYIQAFVVVTRAVSDEEHNRICEFLAEEFLVSSFTPRMSAFSLDMSPINPSAGDEVTYTISKTGGDLPGSFTIEQYADLTDSDFDEDFLNALGTAVAATDGVTLSGSTLAFDKDFVGPLTWARTLDLGIEDGAFHAVRLNGGGKYSELWKSHASLVVGTVEAASYPVMSGVNVAGAEFEYAFYGAGQNARIQYYADKGANVIRLPFNWHRLQLELYADLDATALAAIKDEVDTALAANCYVLLDPHDYGYWNGPGAGGINSAAVPTLAFYDLWEKLAAAFSYDDRIMFGLMNEPLPFSAPEWAGIAGGLVQHLRALGYTNHITVPGIGFTGASTWDSFGNAAAWDTYQEPLNNFSYEVHQYFDSYSNGDDGGIESGSGVRLDDFIDWLAVAPARRKGFLGEFGVSDPAVYANAETEINAALTAWYGSPDTLGNTAWASGPWGMSYHYQLDPANDTADFATTPVGGALELLLPFWPTVKLDFVNNEYSSRSGKYSLSDLATFTRASTKTYINSSGIIQNAGANTPTFDYNPATLAARGISIEGQRTNLVQYSQAFSNAWWQKYGAVTVNDNTVTGKDGTVNASRIAFGSGGIGSNGVYANGLVPAGVYALSVLAKANTATSLIISCDVSGNGRACNFDLSAGTAGAPYVRGSGGTVSAAIATIENYGNGWYRCSLIVTTSGSNSFALSTTAAGNIDLERAQAEAGNFSSSFIPTTGSTVTRAADSLILSSANTVPFANWYNQSEGAFYVDCVNAGLPPASQFSTVVSVTDNTQNERLSIIYRHTTGVIRMDVQDGGVYQGAVGTNTIAPLTPTRFAAAYKANNFASSLNGLAAEIISSGTLPTVNRLHLNGAPGTSDNFLWIKELRYYPNRLTDTQLQAITT